VKLKEILLNLLLVIISILLTWLLLENLAGYYLRHSSSSKIIERWEFRSSCPLPYQNAPYFNSQFIKESSQSTHVPTAHSGFSFYFPGDISGTYFNVRNGLRATTDQPDKFSNTLLLFGGSTIFCSEVPDRYTVASYLQRLINLNHKNLRVENLGVSSIDVSQQTARLLQNQLTPGDIVVFYDGANDVMYPIYNGPAKGGTSHGVRRLNIVQKTIFPLAMKFQTKSSIAKLILKRIEYQPPFTIADDAAFEENLAKEEDTFATSLISANKYVKNKGGVFYHFLQPNIYMLPHPTPYEKGVMINELMQFPGLDIAFNKGYPRLRGAINKTKNTGMQSFDISDSLRERKKGEEYFLDSFHVNHLANAVIAKRIYDSIFNGDKVNSIVE
jgi:lysophospholipase L1-like esterase